MHTLFQLYLNTESYVKPTKLRLTKKVLDKTPGLKLISVIDYDPEITSKVYYNGILIGYCTYTGRVELLRMKKYHKDLFINLPKAV